MIRYFRPYQRIHPSAAPEQDPYAPIPENRSECDDPDRFRIITIHVVILIGTKSLARMLKKVQEYWNDLLIIS